MTFLTYTASFKTFLNGDFKFYLVATPSPLPTGLTALTLSSGEGVPQCFFVVVVFVFVLFCFVLFCFVLFCFVLFCFLFFVFCFLFLFLFLLLFLFLFSFLFLFLYQNDHEGCPTDYLDG